MLPAVLYGRETWSLASKEEHKLEVFQKGLLRQHLDSSGINKRLQKIL
jgi:hypothetical protein